MGWRTPFFPRVCFRSLCARCAISPSLLVQTMLRINGCIAVAVAATIRLRMAFPSCSSTARPPNLRVRHDFSAGHITGTADPSTA